MLIISIIILNNMVFYYFFDIGLHIKMGKKMVEKIDLMFTNGSY